MQSAFLSPLKALAIFLQAAALHAVAATLLLRRQGCYLSMLSIAASDAATRLAAGLTRSETLTVFGLTVAFDTAAA